MIDEDGNLDLAEYQIESKSGKFFVKSQVAKYSVLEVTEDVFKSYLASTAASLAQADPANAKNYSRLKNTLDFMLNQLTEDTVFNLKIMSNSWTFNV